MKKSIIACVFALAFSILGVDAASAQSDTFMLVPGISGGSTDDQHRNWINLQSLVQTLEVNGRRRSSCEIQVVKGLDIAGPPLWAAAVTGQLFPEVRIEVVSPGDRRQVVYEIKLGNARISTISTALSSVNSFSESIVLAAETATLTVFQQRPDGGTGSPVSSTASCR